MFIYNTLYSVIILILPLYLKKGVSALKKSLNGKIAIKTSIICMESISNYLKKSTRREEMVSVPANRLEKPLLFSWLTMGLMSLGYPLKMKEMIEFLTFSCED